MHEEISSNIRELANKLNAKPEHVKEGMKQGGTEAASMAVDQERVFLTPHSKSGKLLRAIRAIQLNDYGWSVGPMMDEIYPLSIENGREGFTAKGLRDAAPAKGSFFAGANMGVTGFAMALRFADENGNIIFRKRVGPAKATPFVKPTHESMKVLYPKIMDKNIRIALDK